MAPPPLPVASLILWVCLLRDGIPQQVSLVSTPVAELRRALGKAVVFITEGPARWLRVGLMAEPGHETAKAARYWVERVAPKWCALDVEPRHTLFLRSNMDPVELGTAELRGALVEWATVEQDIEVTVTDHPTIPHLLRVDVAGRLSEETFHLWDSEASVWALDPEALRAERVQSEPAMCVTCDGCGCTECGQTGIVPCPIGGYDGEAGGP